MKNIYKVFLIAAFMLSCYWLSKQHNDTYAAAPFSNIRTTIVGGAGASLTLSTWNGPSNILQLNNSFWIYSAIGNVSITNVSGVDTNNNLATWATIVISNQFDFGDIVSYSAVPFARKIGAQTFNPLAIPPHKVAIWSYLAVGSFSTNFVNSVQDAIGGGGGGGSGVSLVAAGTNIFIITNSGLATISLSDPTILDTVETKNLYGSNWFTSITNAPFLATDANGQIVSTNQVPSQTNNLFVTTNIIVYSNLTVFNDLYVSNNVFISNNLYSSVAYITNLYTSIAYITNLYTDIAYITNLYSSTAYITNLYSSIAYITNLYSSTAFITNLYSSIAYITNLYSSTAFITNLYSSQAFITNLYASTNFSTNLYFLSGKGNTLIITNNLNLDYLVINKLLATDGAKNVTNADVTAKFTFTGNKLDLADLSTTYELHVATLTNTIYGTNINYGPTLFVGPSNAIILNNGYQTYVTTTPVSITNWSLANNGTWASLAISNNNGDSITGYCTIPNIRFIGTQSTNALVIPNGKIGIWSFLDVNLMSNCVNNVQQ